MGCQQHLHCGDSKIKTQGINVICSRFKLCEQQGDWLGDFPGGSVVKNLTANAGDIGSIPGLGTEIPCPSGKSSLNAATTKPMCPRTWATRETTAVRSPRAAIE